MLEFAMPTNASGKWRITILGNMNTASGNDAAGYPISPAYMPPGLHPKLALLISAAGQYPSFLGPGTFPYGLGDNATIVEAAPDEATGVFAVHENIQAEKAPTSSLYIDFIDAPWAVPYAVAIYDVTAEPLDPVINTKPGKRRAYFS